MIDETNPAEPRVMATQAALDFIREIQADHPDILFHQSGGCCDGSSPMCYPAAEYRVGETDVKLGEIGGVPVYISGSQYAVWKHTQLIIDVVPGRGGMFSLDNGRERRFLTRSRLFAGGEACTIPAVEAKPSA
ncbi:MAG: DUF779 domain-containing protein [Alphaproteobacteria bacterium]|nr:DUF779 domain-containing protein [Rhizobiaceae bacterium]MBC7150470.1 DUF779 domain-containing protein [Rhizobium sp.]MBU3960482.1 DUF779 domain-containing protein [Alphaproteobacteria bacterium]MBU4052636.1 DUF779 domain-containing protein [Alphaproteobacteria bacterium]MBU4089054.1 DUF779 domain-containing protein [Alphaproteobacteria bacterium]